MARNAIQIDILPEDLAWAERQNQSQCAIVRAIQRKIPQALFVIANAHTIAFSIPDEELPDGSKGVRYIFETPASVVNDVIRPFDETGTIPESARSFSLTHAIEARPMQRLKPEQRARKVVRERNDSRRGGSRSQRVRTYGRFLDSVAEENDDRS